MALKPKIIKTAEFADNQSIYKLITKLCESLVQDTDTDDPDRATVQKARSIAYGVLLNQTLSTNTPLTTEECLDEFRKRMTCAKIFSPSDVYAAVEYNKLIKCKKLMEENKELFSTPQGCNLLMFLLKLAECDPRKDVHNLMPVQKSELLLSPGLFTLYNVGRLYDACPNICELSERLYPQMKRYKGIDKESLKKYLQQDSLMQTKSTFAITQINNEEYSKPNLERFSNFYHISKSEISSLSDTALARLLVTSEQLKRIRENVYHQRNEKQIEEEPEFITRPCRVSYSWESFGIENVIPVERQFLSDMKISIELQQLIMINRDKSFTPLVTSTSNLLNAIKLCTIGIKSDIINLDENGKLVLLPNITVENLLPTQIAQYAKTFLKCGTCFRKMKYMVQPHCFKYRINGFIFLSLCDTINEYLCIFRQFILAQTATKLSTFYLNTSAAIQQFVDFTKIVAIDSKIIQNDAPGGCYFLAYIWHEIQQSVKSSHITLLVFLLKRMCSVYYKHLQKWIYNGVLDDPSHELFICYTDEYAEQTKQFFDNAYFVQNDLVPGFLQSCEELILLCGKYTMLLKSYNPQHAIFELTYPNISLCLNEEDLMATHHNCATYRAQAAPYCQPISMKDIYERRDAERLRFKERVKDCTQAHLQAWREWQDALSLCRQEKRNKQLRELNIRYNEIVEEKTKKRIDKLEEELHLQRQIKQYEEETLKRTQSNLQRRIKYLRSKSDIISDENASVKDLVKSSSTTIKLENVTLPTKNQTTENVSSPDDSGSSAFASCSTANSELQIEQKNGEWNEVSTDDLTEDNTEETDTDYVDCLGYLADESETMCAIKRSVSDVLNSNNESVQPTSELECNRVHMASSNNSENVTVIVKTDLKEAQLNKLRVMNEEFYIRQPDINLNTLPDEELSDLERNRQHMLKSNIYNVNLQKDIVDKPAKDFVPTLSEFEINRRRMQHSVLGMTREERAALILEIANYNAQSIKNETVATPMSTSSDISCNMYEQQEDIDKLDAANNNKNNSINNNNQSINEIPTAEQQQFEIKKKDICTSFIDEDLYDTNYSSSSTNTNTSTSTSTSTNTNRSLNTSCTNILAIPEGASITELITACSLSFQQQFRKTHEDKAYTRTVKFTAGLMDTKNAIRSKFNINEMCQPLMKLHQSHLSHYSTIMIQQFLQRSIMLPLETHYSLVRNEVMRIFLEELNIYDHFRSLRNYFFMYDGEFGSLITEGIIAPLENGMSPQALLSYQTLHGVLDKALGASTAGFTVNSQNLSFIVTHIPTEFNLSSPSVLDVLSLSYKIEWPLNLILNTETLDRYTIIFQYLFKLRRVSYVVDLSYQYLRLATKKFKQYKPSQEFCHLLLLRHKLAHFVMTFKNHLDSNALRASWQIFKSELVKAHTIEILYHIHAEYLKKIMFLCLLNRRSIQLHSSIDNILKIVLRFHNVLTSREIIVNKTTGEYTHPRYQRLALEEIEFEKFLNYTIYLGKKAVENNYQQEFGDFVRLIDFNEYYASKDEKYCTKD